ncbi:hypothetical protein LJR234_006637 [Mesorhizobium amorphae]|uniref:hypothetical protein n=1 Tax=Mesorhizobium amorphae TaxID=71433 RepID=UPI003ED11F00
MKGLSTSYLTDLLAASPEARAMLEKTLGSEVLETVSKISRSPLVQAIVPKTFVDQSAPESPPPVVQSMLEAAVSYNFSPETSTDQAIRAWLVRQAAMVSSGAMRLLRLYPRERQRILDAPEAASLLLQLLADYEPGDKAALANKDMAFERLVDAYIREFLRGNIVSVGSHVSALSQRAVVAAREALDGIGRLPPSAPSLAECRRQADLAEILMPLGVIIGVADDAPIGSSDRFVGRSDQLATLRSVVDELASETLLEGIRRSVHRLVRTKPRLLTIKARGGLGKTALVAKFLYDHATRPSERFPFAYLDFDRSDIQPRAGGLMLLEICRQVASQYGEEQSSLDQLSGQIRNVLAGRATGSLSSWCETFRVIIKRIISRTGQTATFLLVLDTLEIVDADPDAISGVVGLVRTLVEEPFLELCLVAAGRSGLEEFLEIEAFEATPLVLAPLSVDDARAMVIRLGSDLLKYEWQPDWAARLAGRKKDPAVRREPLSLRLAVELVRNADPSQREKVVADIERDGEKADEAFVARLYERRILDHVRDKRAQKLAWPGLVARRVTLDIAKNVLAPICKLTPDEAEAAFAILAREGWIVDVEDGGKTLRHRRDLRARTLPLMRRHRPELFNAVADALIDYYDNPHTADPVENVYYRLLRSEDDKLLSAAIDPSLLSELLADLDDFEVGSPAWVLLQARCGRRPLELEAMRRLPDGLVWDHLGRTGSGLRGVNDRKIEPRTAMLMHRGPPNDPAARGPWQAIQIKCGLWNNLLPDHLVIPFSQYDLTLFAFYISQLSLSGYVKPDFWEKRYPSLIERLYSARGTDNWHALTFSLITAQLYNPALAAHIDRRIVSSLEGASGQGRLRDISLRTLLALGNESRMPALSAWRVTEPDRISSGISFAEFAVLAWATDYGVPVRNFPVAERLVEQAQALWGSNVPQNVTTLPRVFHTDKQVVLYASEMIKAIGSSSDVGRVKAFGRIYCQTREPEWIVPFAYLLNSSLQPDWKMRLQQNLSPQTYSPVQGGLFTPFQTLLRRAVWPNDLVVLLTAADRAGDLGGILSLLQQSMRDSAVEAVSRLQGIRQKARHRFGELADARSADNFLSQSPA